MNNQRAILNLKEARFASMEVYPFPKKRGAAGWLENTAEFRIPTRQASNRGRYRGCWFTACFRVRKSFDELMDWFVHWHWKNRESIDPFILQHKEHGSSAGEPSVIGRARWGILILDPRWSHLELPFAACSLEEDKLL